MRPTLAQIGDIVKRGYSEWDSRIRATCSLEHLVAGELPFAIAPAARIGRRALHHLAARDRLPVAFCDGNRALWGTSIGGVPVMSYEEFASSWPECTLFIASALHDSAIQDVARHCGIRRLVGYPCLAHCYPEMFCTREYAGIAEAAFLPNAFAAIEALHGRLVDDQSRHVLLSKVMYYLTYEKKYIEDIRSTTTMYWDADLITCRSGEVVVDGGAFRGDTLLAFLGGGQREYLEYHAFEPDPLVQQDLEAVAACDRDRIRCHRLGLCRARGKLQFVVSGAADTSAMGQAGDAEGSVQHLEVTDLDSFFGDRNPPTFIKMDIEGSERSALVGASRLIRRHRPTLAVSVYHHPRDLWEIPLLIAELTPNSSLYLRHYTREVDDTVCYSVPAVS